MIDEAGHRKTPAPSHGTNNLPLVVWFLAPVLAVLIPSLSYHWAGRVVAFRPMLFITMTSILAVFTVATWALLHFLAFNRDTRRSTGVVSVIVVTVFLWPLWSEVGEVTARITRVGILEEIVPVLGVTVLLWVAVRYAIRDRFAFALVGVFIGLVVVFGAGIAPSVVTASDGSLPVLESGPKPDVVVLILDAYARADVLASQYGFDNSGFLDELTKRGFQIRDDAVANYTVTHGSLPSMMAMDYPFVEEIGSSSSLDRMRQLLSGDGELMHTFESAGYETVMLENAWSRSNCGGVPDRCHRTGLLRRSLWALGQMSPLATIQSVTIPHPFTAIGLQHIRELGDVIDAEATVPTFVFAHVTLPHPPMQLNASCEFVVESDRWEKTFLKLGTGEEERAEFRSRYVDQMKCVNSEVIAAVDRLLATSEDIEIVIVSDHGPGTQSQFTKEAVEWTDSELLEQLSVLSAVKMPGRCVNGEPARSTVNTIRRAVACALGRDFADLSDRSFVVRQGTNIVEPIVEVTDRLNSISATSDR